ncbi:hypothetical protein D3C72_1458900 [compost metagenome]
MSGITTILLKPSQHVSKPRHLRGGQETFTPIVLVTLQSADRIVGHQLALDRKAEDTAE